MTPENFKLLEEWRLATEQVAALKSVIAKEQELRKQVFEAFFPAPKEGANTINLPEGWKLKGTYKIERKIDEAALPAVIEKLRIEGVNSDLLVEYKPSLKTTVYKQLVAEHRAIFDEALTAKPATPTVELNPPKKKD